MSGYEGDRFADTIPYARSYRECLPELARLLPGIQTPVRIVAGADDQVVPGYNAEFLHERLPNAEVDLIAGAGHFCWEEKPVEYAGIFSEFEREMIVARVNAGLARARDTIARDGHFINKAGKKRQRLGHPNADPKKVEHARRELANGTGVLKTAKLVSLGTGTVQRLKRETGATVGYDMA